MNDLRTRFGRSPGRNDVSDEGELEQIQNTTGGSVETGKRRNLYLIHISAYQYHRILNSNRIVCGSASTMPSKGPMIRTPGRDML